MLVDLSQLAKLMVRQLHDLEVELCASWSCDGTISSPYRRLPKMRSMKMNKLMKLR